MSANAGIYSTENSEEATPFPDFLVRRKTDAMEEILQFSRVRAKAVEKQNLLSKQGNLGGVFTVMPGANKVTARSPGVPAAARCGGRALPHYLSNPVSPLAPALILDCDWIAIAAETSAKNRF